MAVTGLKEGAKYVREYLLHYLDSSFNGEAPTYYKLGKDLEEYTIELNPDTETFKNIWGEATTTVKGYEPSSEVQTYYARKGDALFTKLADIVNGRKTGSELETTVVDLLVDSDGTVVWAYREDVVVVPTSVGGGTEGVNIPFTISYIGNRVKGTWDASTKKFTPEGVGA